MILPAVTSQMRPTLGFGEALINDWQAAGLLKPSVLKSIVFTGKAALLSKTVEKFTERDQRSLRGVLQTILG